MQAALMRSTFDEEGKKVKKVLKANLLSKH